MRISRWAIVLAIGVLGGCDGAVKDKSAVTPTPEATPAAVQATTPQDPSRRSAAAKNTMTANEVAAEARGNVKCPATITSIREAGAPVDDVVGVRPGMSYDEAVNVVLCTNELIVVTPENSRGFNIQFFGQKVRQGFNARFAEPKVEKTSKELMQEMQDRALARGSNTVIEDMKPGQSKWYVGTIGMPGQERVINVAREEWFDESRNPTVASVEEALMTKYGTATRKRDAGPYRSVTWAYDPMNQLITESSPLYDRCTGIAHPNAGVHLSPDCGTVVQADIYSLKDNPAVARYLQVGVVDQADGYELLMATEKGLQAAEAERQRKEVENASKNAVSPTL